MNDYQAGLRHNLEIVEVFDDSSIMGDLVPKYKGLTTLEARKLIVKKLEEIEVKSNSFSWYKKYVIKGIGIVIVFPIRFAFSQVD